MFGSHRGRRRSTSRLWLVLAVAVAAAAAGAAVAAVDTGGRERHAAPALRSRPSRIAAPAIAGVARPGQRLTVSRGSWSGHPRAFSYTWRRCDRRGRRCRAISRAGARTYRVRAGDVGFTLRVSVVASNRAGRSRPALSAPTPVVAVLSGALQHLEYVLVDGLVSVYDIDQAQRLVKTIALPQTRAGIRGATASPSTHMLFVSYGGDGGGNGDGAVLAYDLVRERVVWDVHYSDGIDSGAVDPSGERLYMPTGENSSSGRWNILDTASGAVVGHIQAGAGPHNTIVSASGRYVYLGGRNHDYLEVYEPATRRLRSIGPLMGGVRPFTVNASDTIAFTTATDFDGFQVSSLASGKVLFTISFGRVPGDFPYSAPSHGISLSPDGRQAYVIDAVHKQVRAYDVSRVGQGVAPSLLGAIRVPGLDSSESPCAYDCAQDGWVQHSLDGRYVYVGDSGAVIDTATRRISTVLRTLANTRKSLEIDWQDGVPVTTSGRTGVGRAP